MIGDKVEGTIVFDGLIQGRVPSEAVAAQLQEWIGFVARLGPKFSLELRGGTFSLLPESQPVPTQALGDDPGQAIRQVLEQLAGLFTGPERGQLFSTLRSSEYRPKREVQSVYTITGGQVGVQSRTIEADTTPPPVPLTVKERAKIVGVGVGAAVLVLGLSLLIPSVRAMFGQLFETVKPFSATEIQVDEGPYGDWLQVEVDDKTSHSRALAVTIKRTAAYPGDDASYAKAEEALKGSVQKRFALENLGRGFVRAEIFDADGKFVAPLQLRTVDLHAKESLPGTLPLPERTRVARIALVP